MSEFIYLIYNPCGRYSALRKEVQDYDVMTNVLKFSNISDIYHYLNKHLHNAKHYTPHVTSIVPAIVIWWTSGTWNKKRSKTASGKVMFTPPMKVYESTDENTHTPLLFPTTSGWRQNYPIMLQSISPCKNPFTLQKQPSTYITAYFHGCLIFIVLLSTLYWNYAW